MQRLTGRIMFIVLATFLFMGRSDAQSKTVGSTYSFAGIGVVYEYVIDDDTFAEFQLKAETAPVLFTFGTEMPGISASFTWNMVFASTESRNGNTISFFAGPGAALGISEDIKGPAGLFFGLKGRIGGECTFLSRNVSLSVSLSPVLGAHIRKERDMITMLPYKFGLLSAIMPEIGIKYAF